MVGKCERMGRRRSKDGRRKSGGVQQAMLHYRCVATTVKDPISESVCLEPSVAR